MLGRNRIIYVVLVGLIAIGLIGCGQRILAGGGPNPQSLTQVGRAEGEPMPRVLSVNGVGVVNAPPDVADIQLGVEIVNADPKLVVSESTERMAAVMDVLGKMNVEAKDIQTVNYSMWIEPQYDKEGQPTGENRYHIVHQVRVRLRDLAQVGELLQKALEAGANTVGGVTFSVADPAALQQQARDLAIANARTKAQQLAAGLGAQLGELRQVSEHGGWVAPVEAVMVEKGIGGGGGPVPVSGGAFSVSVEIQTVFDLE